MENAFLEQTKARRKEKRFCFRFSHSVWSVQSFTQPALAFASANVKYSNMFDLASSLRWKRDCAINLEKKQQQVHSRIWSWSWILMRLCCCRQMQTSLHQLDFEIIFFALISSHRLKSFSKVLGGFNLHSKHRAKSFLRRYQHSPSSIQFHPSHSTRNLQQKLSLKTKTPRGADRVREKWLLGALEIGREKWNFPIQLLSGLSMENFISMISDQELHVCSDRL